MLKKPMLIQLDADVYTKLKENPQLNITGLINRLLREYLAIPNYELKAITKMSYEQASVLLSETKKKIVTLEKQKETINVNIDPLEYARINSEIIKLQNDLEMYRKIKIAQVDNYY